MAVIAEQGLVTGDVPLTPIQHWFFEQNFPNPHYFNQAVLLAESALNPVGLMSALDRLLIHHDGLRSRFRLTETGWQQIIMPPDANRPFTVFNYCDLPADQQTRCIEQAVAQLQASLHLTTGPLLRVALFQLGSQQPDRLLLVLHHLIVDGVSWRILLDDLQTAYSQFQQGQPIQLPPKTTSYQSWAQHLQQQTPALAQDADYWLRLTAQLIQPLPIDVPTGRNTVETMAQIDIHLSPKQTHTLLTEVPRAYNTQITDVLLTALGLTLQQWTGHRTFLIDLEGHGREPITDEIDLSRTVGWFTTIAPILLTLETTDLGLALRQVKEQLRALPRQGMSYGILRFLNDNIELKQSLARIPSAPISFNYLGQLDRTFDRTNGLHVCESVGATQDPAATRYYAFEITSSITAEQLHLSWSYSREQYATSTIAALTAEFHHILLRLIEHCQASEAGGYTPSDFALANLDQSQLDTVLAAVEFVAEQPGDEP